MVVELDKLKQIAGNCAMTSMPGDPLHPGHISCLQDCRRISGSLPLVCIVNDDEFLARKKGCAFMPLADRCYAIDNIKNGADYVVPFHPSDPADMTVCEAIRTLKPTMFLKGGDRKADSSLPEWDACQEVGFYQFVLIRYVSLVEIL